MSHRTQITLEDDQYERLLAESHRTKLGLAELVRRAINQTYGPASIDEFRRALDESFGAWPDGCTGEEYVEQIRPARSDRFIEW